MSNDDKLKVIQKFTLKKAFKELTIVRDTIFWVDFVSQDQNHNAIFARRFNQKNALPQKLTNKKYNIKNTFHGYVVNLINVYFLKIIFI